jgi:ABC-type sugar transport system permease subunit
VLLDLNLKGKQLFRLIFLLPLSFSFVASASMWTWMFSPEIGSVNALLRAIGLDSLTQPWITSDKQALICIAIAYVWQFSGFSTLVYYAGISGVAPEITEAAKIDGASTFQRYMKVIIPMQRPATLTVLMILLMYSLRVFDLVWLMTGGGPGSSTEILSTFMFRTAFNRNRFGYGAAVGVVMFAISILIVIPFFARLRRSEYE